jgi:hypothetical protein
LIYQKLFAEQQDDGSLPKCVLLNVGKEFGVTRQSISRILNHGKQSLAAGDRLANILNRKQKTGRKEKTIDVDRIKAVPLRQRGTLRALATALGDVSSTIIHRRIKDKSLIFHSSAVKPFLTDVNKLERLKFCLSMLMYDTLQHRDYEFDSMMWRVYLDEKWFQVTRTQTGYILALDKTDPHRTCKSKRFIDKIMFLCVDAQPRWDTVRNQYFDGKIGMYPFITIQKAKRASRNRPRGADVIKPVDVDREVSRRMLIDKVFLDIRAIFPKGWDGMGPEREIELQQDNATPHVNGDDEELTPELVKDGIKIVLINQPPNSPDMNV